jgi:hypothetical protein
MSDECGATDEGRRAMNDQNGTMSAECDGLRPDGYCRERLRSSLRSAAFTMERSRPGAGAVLKMGRRCLAVLLCLAAGVAAAATDNERLARGEILVTSLPAAHKGIVGGQSRGVIPAPVDRVWAVLNRSGEFSDYMPNTPVSWLIDPSARAAVGARPKWQRPGLEAALAGYRRADWPGDTVLLYSVLDVPFPVSDRWYLLEMTRDTVAHSIRWKQVTGNVESNDGLWQLTPWPDAGHTLVSYTTSVEPGIAVPGFILDIGIRQSLPGIINSLRKRVMQAEGEGKR